MDDGNSLLIRPGDVSNASGQLAELADRMSQLMDTEALNLTVEASARDEVSQRVALTLNHVHTSFAKATDGVRAQIQDVATAVRTHTGHVVSDDEGVPV